MNNNFEFLRQFYTSDSKDIMDKVFKSLSNEGLEVYLKKAESDYLIVSSEADIAGGETFYLAAADCEFAESVIGDYITEGSILDYKTKPKTNSELEIAQEKYYKKRKLMYIETAVIIVIGIIYYLLKK